MNKQSPADHLWDNGHDHSGTRWGCGREYWCLRCGAHYNGDDFEKPGANEKVFHPTNLIGATEKARFQSLFPDGATCLEIRNAFPVLQISLQLKSLV